MRMKTIKQIADEMGLPKHKVKYQAEKLPNNCAEKTEGIIYVTAEGERKLQEILLHKGEEKSEEKFGEIAQQLVDMLKLQLEAKDKQIELQGQQITELTMALTKAQQTAAAAQALHAGTMTQQHLTDGSNFSQGFFSRIFRWQKRGQ